MDSETDIRPYWANYSATYRAREMETIAGWLAAGKSGTVAGLPGTGRATLLNYLCQRPDVLPAYLPQPTPQIVTVPVDLNNLPDDNLSTFYRIVLRAFHEVGERFPADFAPTITATYHKYAAAGDPFLPQSGLRELLLQCQSREIRVALVLDRFDHFCEVATPEMTRTLRAMRDSFKDVLCYIAGTHQEVVYLSDWPGIEPVYHLLDSHVCWVGPLVAADAAQMVARHVQGLLEPMPEAALAHLLSLTGGYPSLLQVACNWWMTAQETPLPAWADILGKRQDMQHRLQALWAGLSQEEQAFLAEQQKPRSGRPLSDGQVAVLRQLAEKGMCQPDGDGWQIVGELVAAHVTAAMGRSRGKIWVDAQSDDVFQGSQPLSELTPQERAVLKFLAQHPRVRHTHTRLIEAAWPDGVIKEGVSTEALYQTIRGIRKKIEPNTQTPCYIINWRGQQEGGYQFFPEGRPSS